MINSSKSIKKASRKIFGENAVASILATCICLFVYFIIYIATAIFAFSSMEIVATILFLVCGVLFLGPIILGLIRFFNRTLINEKDNPISVFYYFTSKRKYLKSLSFILLFFGKILFRGVLLYLPAIFIWFFATDTFYSFFNLNIPFWSSNLQPFIIGINVIASVFFIFYIIKLYLAPCLFVIDENMDVDECFLMSKVISKKSSVDYIFMAFSFFGWIILSVLWVPLIFTVPYFLIAYLIHSRQAIYEYNSHVDTLQQNNIQQYYEGV